MKSNFASLSAWIGFDPDSETRPHPLKKTTPCFARPEPIQRAKNKAGTFSHGYFADFVCGNAPYPPHSLADSFFARFGSEPVWKGVKWRERPPRFRIPLGTGPPCYFASRGPVPSSPMGVAPATVILAGRLEVWRRKGQ